MRLDVGGAERLGARGSGLRARGSRFEVHVGTRRGSGLRPWGSMLQGYALVALAVVPHVGHVCPVKRRARRSGYVLSVAGSGLDASGPRAGGGARRTAREVCGEGGLRYAARHAWGGALGDSGLDAQGSGL